MAVPSIKEILERTKVFDIVPSNLDILSVSSGTTLGIALEKMRKRNVRSVPVLNANGKFLNLLDMNDVVSFVLASVPAIEEEPIDSLASHGEKFRNTPVDEVIEVVSKLDQGYPRIFPLQLTSSLEEAVKLFYTGVHLAPVLSETEELVTLLTPFDVLIFIARNAYMFSNLVSKTLEAAKAINSQVVEVEADMPLLKVLSTMYSEKVSAVPVVDKGNDKLIATFSASDLKALARPDGLFFSRLADLITPVHQILLLRRAHDRRLIAVENDQCLHPQTVRKTDTMDYALFKLIATHTHRLWVVDEDGTVDGVVSTADVMNIFFA